MSLSRVWFIHNPKLNPSLQNAESPGSNSPHPSRALHHCIVEMNLIYDPFQCISTIAFVKNEGEVLDSPIWIMLINIVALEMLGAKMPKPTGLYWYLDPTYYSQTDVESLVVVAAVPLLHNPWPLASAHHQPDENYHRDDASHYHFCHPYSITQGLLLRANFIV